MRIEYEFESGCNLIGAHMKLISVAAGTRAGSQKRREMELLSTFHESAPEPYQTLFFGNSEAMCFNFNPTSFILVKLIETFHKHRIASA